MKKNQNKRSHAGLLRRLFGSNKELVEQASNISDVEEIVSPTKQIIRGFRERKLAMFALFVVVAMFIVVFIVPLFMTNYSDSYTEVLHKSLAPGRSMMSVPKALAKDIKSIDSFGAFSVGLSNAGDVYVWGNTEIGTTGVDVSEIPSEVKNAKIEFVAAGYDHIIAIGDDGTVYAWGYSNLGQFGYFNAEENPSILPMPDELLNGKLDVSQIKKVTCGYQCSAILMEDGTCYLWGNKNAYQNLEAMSLYESPLRDIDFTLNYVVAVPQSGNTLYTGSKGLYDRLRSNVKVDTASASEAEAIKTYLNGRKIVSITATSTSVGLLLDDGSVAFTGNFSADNTPLPTLKDGETIVQIAGGAHHYTVLTSLGNVYSCGKNTWDQCEVGDDAKGAAQIFAGSFQSYSVNADGKLTDKWGLKGFFFGTDTSGADILQRIIQGGKMTMTIGAVAVIISSIIGVIIGCISGYFGGFVDMILMRITEIFAAIPFLPFAMILSAMLAQKPYSENTKIFIIMVILGILSWSGLATLVRGQVLVARENEYCTAAKAMGVKESKIAFRHILPNIISVIMVNLTLNFATCLLTESSLSYLGFGVQAPRPTWGNMLNKANNATIIANYWWQWLFPALFLAITVICINIVGDTMRDVMDPKSSNEK